MYPRRSALLLLVLALSMPQAQAQAQQQEIPVRVQPVEAVLIDLVRTAPAEVLALNQSILAAELAAPVSAIHADVGNAVARGELLMELQSQDYELALAQAEATLASLIAQKAQADARLRRARELGANQYLSDDELLARETEVKVIEAQIRAQEVAVAIARRTLQKCRVIAPFDGAVEQRFAQLGAYATPGSPLLELVETGRLELDAEIPDEIADSLKRAGSIRFVSRNESWPVSLLRLSAVVGTERRSRRARFSLEGGTPAVGRSGEVSWLLEKSLLPASLVVRRDGRLGVFLNRDGTAAFMPLPGAEEGRPVPVDLAAGAEIVVEGRERLQDGDRIAPIRSARP